MIYRFPPASVEPSDLSFLHSNGKLFAKLKIENKPGKRTVLLSEHTLIFVLKGTKLLHLAHQTLEVKSNNVILLKKGLYVMAEYIEDGLAFEALMIFLSARTVKELSNTVSMKPSLQTTLEPFIVLPDNVHLAAFKNQIRNYFDYPVSENEMLLPLKAREALLLLMNSDFRNEIKEFILSAGFSEPGDIQSIMDNYLFHPLSIQEYANLSNRSLSAFKRDFQRTFGLSPRQWINQKRLDHGLLLLQNTNKRVAEIAHECGFENVSWFIRQFKNRFGHTPVPHRTKISIK